MEVSFWDIFLNDETLFEHIAYAAGIATVAAFAIQSVRILMTQNMSGLSSYMYTMYSLALICWFAYGVYIECWPLAIANFITFFFTFVILLEILYYDEEDKIERVRRDPLTSVFNKKYYETYLPQLIQENRLTKTPFCVWVGAIGNLDDICRTMGGRYKNRALKQTAKALEKALRDNDFVARIDENLFAVYIANVNLETAKNVVGRVWASVHGLEIKKSDSNRCNIDFCIGVCLSNEANSLSDLTRLAQKALKSASSETPVVFYSKKMLPENRRSSKIQKSIKHKEVGKKKKTAFQ